MSKTVDERVVEMKFDNSHFENNVKTSMSTLDKLKEKLSFKGASQGLESINSSVKKVDMASLGGAVEAVQVKFSALQVMGVTALANITNSAVETAKNIVSMFTIEPVSSGFSEYELKMNSVKTIMASTGESIDTVTMYLDELNEYADKTIYSFSDMTENIGKFTNAGVSLKDATAAIQGVSNVAAVSGANTNEASRAMYNFAQALGTGSVKLIDWKSIDNANMGTIEFKQTLIDTAVSMGMLTDAGDGTYKTLEGNAVAANNFTEALKDEWLSSEVLITTLKKYSDESTEFGQRAIGYATQVSTFTNMVDALKEAAGSGWAQTWEIMFGNLEEAKSLWTDVYNAIEPVITALSDTRNNFLKDVLGDHASTAWKEMSKEIEATGVSLDTFEAKVLEVAKANGEIDDSLIESGKSFKDLMLTGKISADTLSQAFGQLADDASTFTATTDGMEDKLAEFQQIVDDTWYGIYGNGADRVRAYAEAGIEYNKVQALVNKCQNGYRLTLEDLDEEQARNIGFTEEQIAALKGLQSEAAESGTSINNLIQKMSKPPGRILIIDTLKHIYEQFKAVFDAIHDGWTSVMGEIDFADIVYNAIKTIHDFVTSIKIADDVLKGIRTTISLVAGSIKTIGTLSSPVFTSLTKIIGVVQRALGTDFWGLLNRAADLMNEFVTWVNTNNDVMAGIVSTCDTVVTFFENVFASLRESFTELVNNVGLGEFFNNLKEDLAGGLPWLVDHFKVLVSIIYDFVTAIPRLDQINFENVFKLLKLYANDVLVWFSKIGQGFPNLLVHIEQFRDRILSFFGGVEGGVNTFTDLLKTAWENIYKFLKNVKDKFVENFGFAELATVATGAVITIVVLNIIKIFEKLAQTFWRFSGVAKAAAGTFDAMKAMFKEIGKAAKLASISFIIRNAAIALLALVASLLLLQHLDWSTIGKGVVVIVSFSVALGFLAKQMSKLDAVDLKDNPMLGATAVILGIAVAIGVLAIALKSMENSDILKSLANLGVILVAIAGVMGILYGFSKIAKKAEFALYETAGLLLAMSESMIMLSKAMQMLSSIDDVNKAVVAANIIIDLLLVMGIMAAVIGHTAGQFAGKTAGLLLSMSASMLIMVGVIKIINTINYSELGKAALVIGGITIVFAAMTFMSKYAGQNAAKAGALLGGLGAAMMSMVGVVRVLKDIDPLDIAKGEAAILGFTIILSLMTAASFFTGEHAHKAAVAFLGASVAILAMAAATVVLGHLSLPKILKGGIAVLAFGGIMIALTKVSEHANLKDAESAFLNFAIVVGVMAGAVAVLSMLDTASMLIACAGVSVMIIAFGGAMNLIGKEADKLKLGPIIAMTAAVVALGVLAIILGTLPCEQAYAGAIGLAVLITALVGAMLLLQKANKLNKGVVGSLAGLAAVVAGMAIIIFLLGSMQVDRAIIVVAGIAVLFVALAAAVKLASSTSGTGNLALIAVGILALAAAFKVMSLIPFDSLGQSMLMFIGAVAALVVASFIMQSFGEGAVVLAASALSIGGALLMASASVLIFGAGLYVIGLALSVMGTGLTNLGQGIVNFVTTVSGCVESIDGFRDAMSVVGQVILDFLLKLAVGTVAAGAGLVVLALGAVALGVGLAVATVGLVAASIGMVALSAAILVLCLAVTAGMQMIVGAAIALEKAAKQAGVNLVEGFAAGISGAVSTVIQACAGFVSAIANTICGLLGIHSPSTLAAMWGEFTGQGYAQGLENSSSEGESAATSFLDKIKNVFAGDTTLGDSMGNAGSEGASSFTSGLTDGLDTSSFTSMLSGNLDTSSINSLMKSSGSEGASNFTSGLTNGIDTSSFTSMFTDGGFDMSSIKSFMQSSGSDSASSFGSGLTEGLSNISLEDKTSELLGQVNDKADDFNTAGVTLMTEFSNGLSTGTDTAKNTVSGLLASIVDLFANSSVDMSSAGDTIMSSLANGINNQNGAVSSAVSTIVSSAVSTVNDSIPAFGEAGTSMMNSLKTGLESNNINSTIISMLDSCVSAIRGYYESFKQAGKYLGQGFIDGMDAKLSSVISKATELGSKAVEGVNAGAGNNSPSKLTRQSGVYVGEGLVIGMNSMAKAVYNAGASMGETAVGTISDAISTINDTNFDVQPSISPVVDANAMNTNSLRLTANIDSLLSSPIESMSQLMTNAQAEISASNNKVIDAVNGLREDLNLAFSGDNSEIALYIDKNKLASTMVNPINQRLSLAAKRGGGL